MSDVIIKWGEDIYELVGQVFLDGEEQSGVSQINLTQGTIVRGYRGELFEFCQVKTSSGYVFDTEADDFVLEVVEGEIRIVWTDQKEARAWLAKHGQ